MSRASLLMVLLLVVPVLAGCVDDEAPTSDPEPPATSEETGAIKGTILTVDLEPVAGATVWLISGEETVDETVTGDDGKFLIGTVDPGDYKLQVAAQCCRALIKTVEVVADEVAQVDMQLFRLTDDDLQEARVVEEEWTGFISCGVITPVIAAAVCSIPGIVDDSLQDENEDFLLEFEVEKGIKSLVVGMEWSATGGATGEELWLVVDDPGCGIDECTYEYADPSGPSPLVAHIDNEDITLEEWKWDAVETERTIRLRVFAGGDATLAYQQAFTVHYHAFYWEAAPEGYNPIPES